MNSQQGITNNHAFLPTEVYIERSEQMTSMDAAVLSSEDVLKKRTVCHDYHDHANDTATTTAAHCVSEEDEEQQPVKKRRGPRGGVAVPFPEKLHQMLSSVEQEGFSQFVSWQPHGRCFVVHKPKEFVSQVMPFYFRQTKLTSFQRQLNLYGFCRLTSGKDRGGYYHELFLRGRPFLCKRMMRTRIKGTGIKAASSPSTEPDFYSMPPVRDTETVPPSPTQEPVQPPQQPVSPTTTAPGSIVTLQQHSVPPLSIPEISTSIAPPPSVPLMPSVNAPSTMNAAPVPATMTTAQASSPEIAPATVSPLQAPVEAAPAPQELMLTKSDPLPDAVITFEGQKFHYLDPTSFDRCIQISTNQALYEAATKEAEASSAQAMTTTLSAPAPMTTTVVVNAPVPAMIANGPAPSNWVSAAPAPVLTPAAAPQMVMTAPTHQVVAAPGTASSTIYTMNEVRMVHV